MLLVFATPRVFEILSHPLRSQKEQAEIDSRFSLVGLAQTFDNSTNDFFDDFNLSSGSRSSEARSPVVRRLKLAYYAINVRPLNFSRVPVSAGTRHACHPKQAHEYVELVQSSE